MTTVREIEERKGESEEGIIERMPSKRETWKDRTEEWLCDAAIRGDVKSLEEIMEIDEYILDKVLVGSFKGKNPLHMATSTGQKQFVQHLLKYEKGLANAVDTELGTALHIASSKGHLEIVKHLLEVNPGMCMARDREGNNPLHTAAMNGNLEVLKLFLLTNPHAARVKVDRGDNILHLCVNYNQLGSLKLLLDMVRDKEFANSTDMNGNNILHLAVFGKRYEIGNRVSFAGLVLAETLMGLDVMKGNPTAQFLGSPLLLQVWLFEKLKVWDAPERLPYNPDQCTKRRIIKQFPTEAAWETWMKTCRGDWIQWVCPWYGVESMTVSTMNHFGVAVIGITRVIFYFPARFQRQFGAEQTAILGDPEYAVSKVHNANFCCNMLRLWPNRVMQEVAENFSDKLSGSYKHWLKKNLLEDSSAKRRKT